MAVTLTKLEKDILGGRLKAIIVKIAFDSSYPTGGYGAALGLSPQRLGLKTIWGASLIGINAAGAGVALAQWDFTNKKLMAFRVATFTPAGAIGGNVTVVGGAIGEAIGINPDSNSGVLSKAAASNRTIPIATLLGAAPAFTGTAQGQVALAEVSSGVNLAAVTVRMMFIGS